MIWLNTQVSNHDNSNEGSKHSTHLNPIVLIKDEVRPRELAIDMTQLARVAIGVASLPRDLERLLDNFTLAVTFFSSFRDQCR